MIVRTARWLIGISVATGCSAERGAADTLPPAETAPATAVASGYDQPLATASTSTAASVPATASLEPAQPGKPPSAPLLEKRFLPHETACKSDADCAVTASGLSERFFCCGPCEAVAGSKAWVARADAQCVAYRRGSRLHVCPPEDCGPPGGARCNAGHCQLQ